MPLPKNKRFHPDIDEAIKNAKNRARTNYKTQFIYTSEQGYFIRGEQVKDVKWVAKVKFDKSVEYWPTEKEEHE